MKKAVLLVAMAVIATSITGCSNSDNSNLSNNGISDFQNMTDINNTPKSGITNDENTSTKSNSESMGLISVIPEQPDLSNGEIDIDLTQLDSNMVYAQVADLVNNGDKYLGKTVKAKGPFSYFQETDGREFFAVLISDATACCAQGIEFIWEGDHSYPDDYPSIGTEITVVGKFNYYKEDFYTYCQLLDADMEVDDSLSWN